MVTLPRLLLTQQTVDCQSASPSRPAQTSSPHLRPSRLVSSPTLRVSPDKLPVILPFPNAHDGVNIIGGEVKKSGTREINPEYLLPAGHLIASQTSHLQS